MTCKSCIYIEPVVGGDKLVYFCNKKKEFITAPNIEGRFCKERRREEDVKNN